MMLALVAAIGAQTADRSAADLRCELQLDHELLTTRPQNHLHFLLLSQRDGLRVYDQWNMWGYFARAFDLTVAGTKTYHVTRRDRVWDRNFPKSVTVDRGEVLVTDVYLCDGTWRVSPKLPVQEISARAIGSYTLKPRTDAAADSSFYPLEDIWIGTIRSAPLELSLSKECVVRLNADRP